MAFQYLAALHAKLALQEAIMAHRPVTMISFYKGSVFITRKVNV